MPRSTGLLPQPPRGDGAVGVEAAAAVAGDDLAAALPHPRVPDEVLVVVLCGREHQPALAGRHQLVADGDEVVPAGRQVALGQPGRLERRPAVEERERLDLHGQRVDLVADHARGQVVGEEVVHRLLGQVRGELGQHVPVEVAGDVAGADQEDVRALARGERGGQLLAAQDRCVDELDLLLVLGVPAVDGLVHPAGPGQQGRILGRRGRVEVPELQRPRARRGARAAARAEQAGGGDRGVRGVRR